MVHRAKARSNQGEGRGCRASALTTSMIPASELHKFLPTKEECTIIWDNGQWTVDLWNAQGEHEWSKTFDTYEQAKAEYDHIEERL